MREICMLRARWRGLETEPRTSLHGHEGGNPGYKTRDALRATAPVLDPTNNWALTDVNRDGVAGPRITLKR